MWCCLKDGSTVPMQKGRVMVNKWIGLGRLGKDPELRKTSNGTSVCNFSVATSERFKKEAGGEPQEKTSWHNLVAWKGLADVCSSILKKGDLVYVEGKLQYRSYTDRDGNEKQITEIVLDKMQKVSKSTPDAPREEPREEPPFNPSDDIPF